MKAENTFIYYIVLLSILLVIPLNYFYLRSDIQLEWYFSSAIWIFLGAQGEFVINPFFPLAYIISIPAVLFHRKLKVEKLENPMDQDVFKTAIYLILFQIPVGLLGGLREFRPLGSLFFDSIARWLTIVAILLVFIPYGKRKIVFALLDDHDELDQDTATQMIMNSDEIKNRYIGLLVFFLTLIFGPIAISTVLLSDVTQIVFVTMVIGINLLDENISSDNYILRYQVGILPYTYFFFSIILSIIVIVLVYYVIQSVAKRSTSKLALFILYILSTQSMWIFNLARIGIEYRYTGVYNCIPIPIIVFMGMILAFVFRRPAKVPDIPQETHQHEISRIAQNLMKFEGNVEGTYEVPISYRLSSKLFGLIKKDKNDDETS